MPIVERIPNWGNISKEEEHIGLDVIRRIWVPKAVELWNKKHRKYKVTVNEVLKGLRKTRHDSLDPRAAEGIKKYNTSDIIHYSYAVPGLKNESMTFMIHRYSNPMGNPVDMSHPWHLTNCRYNDRTLMAGFFSGAALFEEPVFPLHRGIIPENVDDDDDDDNDLQNDELTKIEENYAFNLLVKYVVPKAAKSWNDLIKDKNDLIKDKSEQDLFVITPSMIYKSLKKIHHLRNRIYYEAKIKEDIVINFTIEKNCRPFVIAKYGRPMVYFGYVDPNMGRYLMYHTPDTNQYTKTLEEETEAELFAKHGTPEINKEEEARGLQFIRLVLVPFAVEKGNKWIEKHISKYSSNEGFLPSTVQQVIKGMKKTHHNRGVPNHIEFEVISWTDGQPHIPLRFWITKGKQQSDQEQKWHLMVGMEDPIVMRNDLYVVKFDSNGKPII